MSGLLTWAAFLTATAAAVRGTWSPCGLSMVSAINPFSEHSRGNRYALTCAWFVAGAVLGGALFGAAAAVVALGVSAAPASAAVLALVGAAAACSCLAVDAGAFGPLLPLHRRQVDDRWLGSYRRWVYASGFGFQIGTGLATYVMTASTVLLAILAALTGSPLVAVLVGVHFGFVRGLAVLLTARAASPAGLRSLHRALEAAGPWSLRLVVVVQAAVGVALAGAASGPAAAALVAVACGALVALGQVRAHPSRRGRTTGLDLPAAAA